jgi:hypothetical protein
MAKLRPGIGSQLSGKAGEMVFVQWEGDTYMRTAPDRSKGSWTPKQTLNRKRFREANNFCSQFSTSLIPMIWKPAARKMPGHSFFLKANLPAFGLDGTLADPQRLQLSVGKLPLPRQFMAERVAAGSSTISVSWNNDPYMDSQRLTDELKAISASNGVFSYFSPTGLVRGTMNGSFELPSYPRPQEPDPMYLYLFFASADKKDYSNSVCFEV